MSDSPGRKKLRVVTIPINFRPLLFVALSIAFGMVLFKFFQTLKIWTILIPLVFFALIFSLIYFFIEKEDKPTATMTVLICVVFALIGGLLLGLNINKVKEGQVEDGKYTVVGVVSNCSYNAGAYNITLTECSYNGKTGGDLFVYGVNTQIDLYDVVEVKCYAKKTEVIISGAISSSFINQWSMIASDLYGITIKGEEKSVASAFKNVTDEVFFNVLGENGGILSALIRGDTSKMKENVNPFRFIGIAHIFAVSGMHVGLLFTAITFLFRKIKLKKIVNAILSCLILFFYSYVCGLSPSSLRAAIMCACIAISRAIGEKYDGINALSVAFIIITVIFPYELFSIGFILSFVISFSIIALSPPLKRFLSFMPEKFAESLSTLIASQLAALPITVSSFGYFSFISFVANLVLLPVVTIIYYCTVIGLICCLILPINELITLFIPKILSLGTIGVTDILSRVVVQITTYPVIFSYAYYPLLITCSDVINVPKNLKFACGIGCITLILCATVLTRIL